MEHDVIVELKQIAARLFHCDPSQITETSGPGSIPGWDSLGHVTLLEEIQRHFSIELDLEVVIGIRSVDELAAAINKALPAS